MASSANRREELTRPTAERGMRRSLLFGYFGLCLVLVVGSVLLTATVLRPSRDDLAIVVMRYVAP